MKAGLFDVLAGRFSDGSRLESIGEESHLLFSVTSNLNYLFNTRSGSVAHLPDYGLPDITEIYRDIPDSVLKLQRALKDAVEKYEPRLRRVRVDPQQTDTYSMRLVFMVSGELANRQRVRFETVFSSVEAAQVKPWRPGA